MARECHPAGQPLGKGLRGRDVHTNTLEGFWSLLKNGIRGAHHAVGSGYLQSYVNEYVFRYNHRDDAATMYRVLSGRVSKTRHGRYGEYAPVGE